MPPAQIQRLRRSFAALLPQADAHAGAFFAQLFAAAPELRPVFAREPRALRAQFIQLLGGAVGLVDKPHVLMPMARRLGERAATQGLRRVHYPVIGSVLLRCLEQALGPAFDDEAGAAWETLYALLVGMVLEGRDNAVAA